ncbi:hypothetical protein FQZ97_937680 [compost metagenome]
MGDGQAKRLGHRQQFAVAAAFGEAVFDLDAGQRRKALQLGQQVGTGDAPGREVRQPGVVDLAGADQVVEAAKDFLHRRHAVGDVRPEDVDMVGLQPLQAFLDRTDHVLAAVAGARDSRVRRGTEGVLGGEYQVVALPADELAQQHLSLAALVAVGGVNEVATGFEVAIEDLLRLVALGPVAPAGAEVAGAQCQFGNAKPALAAESGVAHVDLLWVRRLE